MKKLLVVAALTMAAAPAAMASKARVSALAGSRQVLDFQTAFDRPYQFMALGSQATIEWGAADTKTAPTGPGTGTFAAANPHAEGGFLMKSDDMAYGAYLGRRSTAFNDAVAAAVDSGITNLMTEQNPINLYYASKMGEWTWGVTVKYSNGKDEVADISGTGLVEAKASSMGLAVGASNGTFDVELVQGLTGKTERGDASVESKGMTQIGFGYHINENMEAYAQYGMVKADITDGNAANDFTYDRTGYAVGFVNTVSKTEDANFFYGIAYESGKIKDVAEQSMLPVWMGIEANATSWMVLRASVKQNILINETKVSAANDAKVDVDSIAFNAGLGFKLGKGMLDASFGTANQGHLSFSDGTADKFLSNVAYTYNF
uniref:Major outer membrane protein n=1 Tax=Bdellovibrio bacteriovorus TaxID=959 RepID=Q70EK0_BDEBC|nr:major outer membrane protein [Bdellovibrio bacteriovorus]